MTEPGNGERLGDQEKKIVTSIPELPELGSDSVRAVHLTDEHNVEGILENGLDYSSQGMAMSTARAWSNPDEVQFSSTDPRFNNSGIRAIVLDLSNAEWKAHNRLGMAPGKITPEKIVAVINPAQS